MRDIRKSALKMGLETLYFTGAHRALRPVFGGLGAILTLHRVRPAGTSGFAPNALLEVTPEFLESVVGRVRALGFDIVTLDEARRRLVEGGEGPFVAFTFDDGYRDNLDHAYPILKRLGVPFTLYLATAFVEQRGLLWWMVLEEVVRTARQVSAPVGGHAVCLPAASDAEKADAYGRLYWWLRSLPEAELRAEVLALAGRHGVDAEALCREACMGWAEIERLAADPLVTIGAHTVEHVRLAQVPAEAAQAEIERSKAALEARLGRPVRHFAYPVGDPTSAGPREFALARKAGFETAVTTRPGLVFPEHRDHLHALPRLSLNGHFQSLRYVDVLLSGAAFAFFNRFRRVNAA